MKTNNNNTKQITSPALAAEFSPPHVGNTGNGHYASSDLAQKVQAINDQEIVEPEIDKPTLRMKAFTSGRAGESDVRETAAHSFGAVNNSHVEEIHGILELLEHAIAGAGKHIREISGGMNPAKRYIHTNASGTPWTKASRILFWFFIIISIALLAVGINTDANVLRASGIPAFENPIAAYLFSGIPIALAACLKGLSAYVEGDSRRRIYIIIVWVIGFVFGVLWAFLFAETFRGLTQTTAEIVRSLAESGTATAAPSRQLGVRLRGHSGGDVSVRRLLADGANHLRKAPVGGVDRQPGVFEAAEGSGPLGQDSPRLCPTARPSEREVAGD